MPETQTSETTELTARLAEAERLRDEYLALLKEKQAEFENYQKRSARERAEEMKYFTRALAADLLPALDNLERALAAAAGETGPLLEGVDGTRRQFLDILARHGIARIEVAPGTPLNPNEHEAVMQQPHAELPAGVVIQACTAGYRIHDRILRPASVIVSSGPPSA
jgi:molecular chaperone GrpE